MDDPCLISVGDGSTLHMSYDNSTETVNYVANLINQSYLGLGYGSSMTDTDMVIFSADDDKSTVYPVYSTTEEKPKNQTGSCYADPTVTVLDSGDVQIETSRPLDCDLENFYVITLGAEFPVINAWQTGSPEL